MNGEQRRELILTELQKSDSPISATHFAEQFGVTRQIIVADIALLRASGHNVRAEHRGYVLSRASSQGIRKQIVVKHDKDSVMKEFCAVIDNGGIIEDVIVEHSIYGTISARLGIATRYDAQLFVDKISSTSATPLSHLTQGLHIHTITVPDETAFKRIVNELTKLGIFIEAD